MISQEAMAPVDNACSRHGWGQLSWELPAVFQYNICMGKPGRTAWPQGQP